MPATEPLLARMARTETVAWIEQYGMPNSRDELAKFAEAVALMAGTVYHLAGRARIAERREHSERSA